MDQPGTDQTGNERVAVSCALCGSAVASPPITWMYERDQRRGGRWYCQDCARANLRAVEAKLDEQWW